MKLINQQSFTLAAVFILILVIFLLFRDGAQRRDYIILGFVVVGMAILWFIIRPTESPVSAAEQVKASIGAGTPVLLEFQSPY